MEQAPFHAPSSKRQSLDEWILDDPQASFLMKMEGNSMHDHGVYHGDMLVIERATEPRINDLVVTVRDGAWAIMSYQDLLKSHIKPNVASVESLTVQAVIRALVRKYG